MTSIHVISKSNNAEHHVVSLSSPKLAPLQDGHIYARSRIVALTANNLTYARLGTMLSWWDTYPVPASLPAPYNDPSQYGIVPVWGYAEVVDSRVNGLEPGMLIWGYWPSYDAPVDLALVPDGKGRWYEVSPHRGKLMKLYQRYFVNDPTLRADHLSAEQMDVMAWEALMRPVGAAGWFISRFIFGKPAIHPDGSSAWTDKEADLSKTTVINLSASGKTARAFTDALIAGREPGTGPLGMMAITASHDSHLVGAAPFPTKTVQYSAIGTKDTVSWIAQQKPSRVIIVDFGGRGNALEELLRILQGQLRGVPVLIVGVGAEAKITTTEETMEGMKKWAEMSNRLQANASPIRDAAIEKMGADAFYKDLERSWEGFLQRGNLKNMKLKWENGVKGRNGLEGGWDSLCEGKVPSDVGLACKL